MLSGCSKDDNNDPDTPPTGDIGKVRYEATAVSYTHLTLFLQLWLIIWGLQLHI